MAKARSIQGDEVLSRQLADPAFRSEWERTAFARAIALRVVTYRADHDLSQSALGRRLRMAQSGVARLESGEHTPTLETLQRLSTVLGTGFVVGVDPDGSLFLGEQATGGDHAAATSFEAVTITRLAAYLGRYDLQEAKFRDDAAA
jgi:transcriptional regulator with XRE-family HTH domain